MAKPAKKSKGIPGYTIIEVAIPTKYIDDLMLKHGGTDIRLAIQHAILTYQSRW